MGQPSIVDLFSTPLLQWDIGKPGLIEDLLAEVMAARPGQRDRGAEKVDIDFFDDAAPARAEFRNAVYFAAEHFIKSLALDKEKTELPDYQPHGTAWVINKGDFLMPWESSRNDLSGAVYLDSGDATNFDQRGFLEYLDPRVAVKMLPGRRLSVNAKVMPVRGLMVLYPSWFKRVLYPYEGENPRVLYEFDIRFTSMKEVEAPEDFLNDDK